MITNMLKNKKKWVQLTDKDEVYYAFCEIKENLITLRLNDLVFESNDFSVHDDCLVIKSNGAITFILRPRNANSIYLMLINDKKIINKSVLY